MAIHEISESPAVADAKTPELPAVAPIVDRESLRQRYACSKHFIKTISRLALFKNSTCERLVMIGLSVLSGPGGPGGPGRVPVQSTVVPRMLIWERFLAHRSRGMRRMTLAVALHQRMVEQHRYPAAAMAALLTQVAGLGDLWENQPLNVTVAECERHRVLDPRRTTADAFRIAVTRPDGTIQVCEFDLRTISGGTAAQCQELVHQQLALETPATGSVSVVFEHQAQKAVELSGRYAQYAGAWLCVAPDSDTGGLAVSADHLVLDGALLQKLLIRMAVSSSSKQDATPTAASDGNPVALPAPIVTTTFTTADAKPALSRNTDQMICLVIPWPGSLTCMLSYIKQALQDSGLQLHEGRDMISLTTIPEDGPDFNPHVLRCRRRVLPVQICLANVVSDDDLRDRVRQANTDGWCSAGPLLVHHLYNGNRGKLVMRYIERVAPKGRLLRAFRYLAGGAVVSFLPPVAQDDLQGARVSHLSALTLGPVQGGPTITVMHSSKSEHSQDRLYVTISGTDDWNCPDRLNSLALALQSAADN